MQGSKATFAHLFCDGPGNEIVIKTAHGTFYHQKIEIIDNVTGKKFKLYNKEKFYCVRKAPLKTLFRVVANSLDLPYKLIRFTDNGQVIRGKTTTAEDIRIRQKISETETIRIYMDKPIQVTQRVTGLPLEFDSDAEGSFGKKVGTKAAITMSTWVAPDGKLRDTFNGILKHQGLDFYECDITIGKIPVDDPDIDLGVQNEQVSSPAFSFPASNGFCVNIKKNTPDEMQQKLTNATIKVDGKKRKNDAYNQELMNATSDMEVAKEKHDGIVEALNKAVDDAVQAAVKENEEHQSFVDMKTRLVESSGNELRESETKRARIQRALDKMQEEMESDDKEVPQANPPPDVNVASCTICLQPKTGSRFACVPCGHQPFCGGCVEENGEKIMRTMGCPICRQEIGLLLLLQGD
jgi:hypothetical protein